MLKKVFQKKDEFAGMMTGNAVETTMNGHDSVLSTGLYVHSEKDIFYHIRKPRSVHWSIAWSDLMMTMFVLFLVMYIYQYKNTDLFIDNSTPAENVKDRINRAVSRDNRENAVGHNSRTITDVPFDDLDEYRTNTFKAEEMEDLYQTDIVSDKAVRIVLPGDLLFDVGKAELKQEALETLGNIGEKLKRTPYMINIVGHTDDVPIHTAQFATNWELSTARACRVARFLIDEKGLPENRFYVSGYAHNQPVAANTSMENRAANRRVEIIVTREIPGNRSGNILDLF